MRIEVHCSTDSGATSEFFRDECRRQIPRCLPAGVRLSLIRLLERAGSEKLHNRYILTDLGGVTFGVGLDEGDTGDTDDIQLLEPGAYEQRWREYAVEASAFDRPEPVVTVLGPT